MRKRAWLPTTLRWRIWLPVGALLMLLLINVVATLIVRDQVSTVRSQLAGILRPAQIAVASLTKSYVDQETGERGFLLTGDESTLAPYTAGLADAARYTRQLNQSLADDPTSIQLLGAVTQAATAWQNQVAEPEMAKARAGTATRADLVASTLLGKRLFDAVRGRLGAFQTWINQLVTGQLQQADAANSARDRITLGTAVGAVLFGALAIVVLRRSLMNPLGRLVDQVRRVSDGELDHFVDPAGPAEVATVATAVEAMRTRILDDTARWATIDQQLARYEEAERIARQLNETVVTRLFRTGLALHSVAARHQSTAAALSAAVEDIDEAIRQLQGVIFGLSVIPSQEGLSRRVVDLVSESERWLGFAPQVRFDSNAAEDLPHHLADQAIASLRTILSVAARRARPADVEISLHTARGALRVLVIASGRESDPLLTKDALTELDDSAVRLGGSCTTRREHGVERIDWTVPYQEQIGQPA